MSKKIDREGTCATCTWFVRDGRRHCGECDLARSNNGDPEYEAVLAVVVAGDGDRATAYTGVLRVRDTFGCAEWEAIKAER